MNTGIITAYALRVAEATYGDKNIFDVCRSYDFGEQSKRESEFNLMKAVATAMINLGMVHYKGDFKKFNIVQNDDFPAIHDRLLAEASMGGYCGQFHINQHKENLKRTQPLLEKIRCKVTEIVESGKYEI